MKKKYMLPFDGQPISCCYPYICFPYAIIHANAGDEYQKWICGKYINCYYKPLSEGHKFIISLYDNWSPDKKIMIYQCINFSKEIIKKLNINIPLAIKKALLNYSYPYGQCGKKYLFQDEEVEEDALFDYIITGYDDTVKQFTIRGFDTENSLIQKQISYEDYVASLFDNPRRNIQIHLWKYNEKAQYLLDLINIKNDLDDYINSKNSKPQYLDNRTFGLQATEALRNHYVDEAKTGNKLLKAYLHGYYEHKYFMLERMQYLYDCKIVTSEMVDYAKEICLLSKRVYECGEKYNSDKNTNHVNELSGLITKAIRLEKEYLPLALDMIRDYIKKTETESNT